ncbi:MAG: hypothetical protein V1246_03475, partial [Arenicellales bacterium]|nr:hypothetical protein [Arenicellales bacterium]
EAADPATTPSNSSPLNFTDLSNLISLIIALLSVFKFLGNSSAGILGKRSPDRCDNHHSVGRK